MSTEIKLTGREYAALEAITSSRLETKRWNLDRLHIRPAGDGHTIIEASDGRRLLRIRAKGNGMQPALVSPLKPRVKDDITIAPDGENVPRIMVSRNGEPRLFAASEPQKDGLCWPDTDAVMPGSADVRASVLVNAALMLDIVAAFAAHDPDCGMLRLSICGSGAKQCLRFDSSPRHESVRGELKSVPEDNHMDGVLMGIEEKP